MLCHWDLKTNWKFDPNLSLILLIERRYDSTDGTLSTDSNEISYREHSTDFMPDSIVCKWNDEIRTSCRAAAKVAPSRFISRGEGKPHPRLVQMQQVISVLKSVPLHTSAREKRKKTVLISFTRAYNLEVELLELCDVTIWNSNRCATLRVFLFLFNLSNLVFHFRTLSNFFGFFIRDMRFL